MRAPDLSITCRLRPRFSAEWNPFALFVVDATPLHASITFGDLATGAIHRWSPSDSQKAGWATRRGLGAIRGRST